MGQWLHEMFSFSGVCEAWPRRWNKYVLPAFLIQRTTPDLGSHTEATPFRLLLGREARTQLDALTPGIDRTDVRRGLD